MELENKGGNTAKPVNKKRILLSIVVMVYAVLAIVGITVVYYDPLFHFHGPKTGGNYLVDNQVYQNPGIARNFDYDSLIVGSSMTELLYPSLFEKEYGVHPVKVSYSGATTKNINIILNQAYNHHKGEIKYVFWGLDIYASEVPEDSLNMEQPEYLYDDKVFNDLSYILNKDILKQIYDNKVYGDVIDYDAMFPWVNEAEFGQQNALRAINISDLSNAMHGELDLSGVTPAENVVANVTDNIIPIVSAHPETTFVFFIPPYPVIHWSTKLSGNINQELINTKYIWEQMNNYDNTQFHMLQFMDNTTNLFLYKDSLHYNYRMGEDVPAALKSMKYIVNSDNAEDMFDRFYHHVEDFDYSIYTGEKYPFQSTTDFSQYISEISDERYIKLLLGSGSVGTLNDEEEAILYANNLLPDDYSRGDFFYVSDKEAYNSFDIEYNYETDDAKASVLVDKIDYVPEYMGITESKMLVIVVIDSETGRVVDVAGLRESTRDLIKY